MRLLSVLARECLKLQYLSTQSLVVCSLKYFILKSSAARDHIYLGKLREYFIFQTISQKISPESLLRERFHPSTTKIIIL